jgi:hypothetical protein
MATGTLGTTTNSALTSINGWTPSTAITDVAAIAALIKNQNAFNAITPGNFSPSGRLFLPGGRGIIQLLPGDYIGVDANGWPVVVSAQSIAGQSATTEWAHS